MKKEQGDNDVPSENNELATSNREKLINSFIALENRKVDLALEDQKNKELFINNMDKAHLREHEFHMRKLENEERKIENEKIKDQKKHKIKLYFLILMSFVSMSLIASLLFFCFLGNEKQSELAEEIIKLFGYLAAGVGISKAFSGIKDFFND